jgi:hypothetical protein
MPPCAKARRKKIYVLQPDKQRKGGPAMCRSPFWYSCAFIGFGLLSGLRRWQDRNKGAAFEAFVEGNCAIDSRKDGVSFAHAYALARPKLGAALTHDDVTRNGGLTTVKFHAEAATG